MEAARILVGRVSIVRRPVDLAAIIEQAVAGPARGPIAAPPSR